MKISAITAVCAAALCVAGCKYDKINEGASGAADGSGETGSLITDIDGNGGDSGNLAETGDLDSLSQRHFEDYLTRCTDAEFAPVYFGLDSTVIPQGELAKIDEVAGHLKAHSDRVTVVEGNCDERGSNEYNMSLGENRAIIIRNYLIQSGISADRIQTRSYGEEKPAAEGHNEAAWARNRRGEFAIFQK